MLSRYQTKRADKGWDEPGPDLLRTRENTVAHISQALKEQGPWAWRKQRPDGSWFAWHVIGRLGLLRLFLDDVLPTLGDKQLGQIGKGGEPMRVVRGRQVAVPDLQGATPRAETTNALIRERFPDVRFAGCFLCKRYNGSTDPSVGWSDHAWGDAVDETENPDAGVRNDDVTDWCVRMATEGLLNVEQILGSAGGKVYSWEGPRFDPVEGGPSSHLWHVHLSCQRHTGEPPCAS